MFHVIRDEALAPGSETWLDLGGDLVFVVSAGGATEGGVRALGRAWAYYLDVGDWRFGPGSGTPVQARCFRTWHVRPGYAAVVTSRPGWVKCYLRPSCFSEATASALDRAVQDCSARAGWRHYGDAVEGGRKA